MSYFVTDPDTGNQLEIINWKYFADVDGVYIGRWDEDDLIGVPAGAVEVTASPPNHDYRWNGYKWQITQAAIMKLEGDAQRQDFLADLIEDIDALQDVIIGLGGVIPANIAAKKAQRNK